MPKKKVIFSIGLIVCVAFLTIGWDWDFDDLGPTQTTTEEMVEEPVEEMAEEPVVQDAGGDITCGEDLSYAGQEYPTVQIGDQCWMVKSLNVGTMISGSSEMSAKTEVEKYCYEDQASNCELLGGLYQWYEAVGYVLEESPKGICPEGWHVPSDAEWYELESSLAAGDCEKSRMGFGCDPVGADLQPEGNSGFQALFAGYRDMEGGFGSFGAEVNFWSSTDTGDGPIDRTLHVENTMVRRFADAPTYGFSVRCVRN